MTDQELAAAIRLQLRLPKLLDREAIEDWMLVMGVLQREHVNSVNERARQTAKVVPIREHANAPEGA